MLLQGIFSGVCPFLYLSVPESCVMILQVIQHPWSKKLNVDIQVTVAAKPENGEAPGSTPATVKQPLPCWDWLFNQVQSMIDEAQRSFSHSAAQPQGGGPPPFVTHGWSLPYSYEDVSAVRACVVCIMCLYMAALSASTRGPKLWWRFP